MDLILILLLILLFLGWPIGVMRGWGHSPGLVVLVVVIIILVLR